MAFAKVKASSTARGYGAAHTRARGILLAAFQPGDPCCLCGHPMYGPARLLDADHLPGTDQYRGLAHGAGACPTCGKHCNRSDGGKRARARQAKGGSRPTRVSL